MDQVPVNPTSTSFPYNSHYGDIVIQPTSTSTGTGRALPIPVTVTVPVLVLVGPTDSGETYKVGP